MDDLKAVVIIRLPPSDDPSEGKFITGAIALRDDLTPSPASTSISSSDVAEGRDADAAHNGGTLPVRGGTQPDQAGSRRRQRRRILPRGTKLLASVLFAALVAYFFWQYDPNSLVLEEGESNDDDEGNDEGNNVVFTVRSKLLDYSNSNSSLPASASVPAYPSSFLPTPLHAASDLVDKDVLRNSRSGAEMSPDDADDVTSIFPLRGNVYPSGIYYAVVKFGNPLQDYFLDMDTGSDITWFQCDAPCTSCAKGPHPLYKPRHAKLVDCDEASCTTVQAGAKYGCEGRSRQCDYNIKYADGGSSLGILVRDQLALILSNRTWGRTRAVVGCAYNQQGSLANSPSPTDGVLGLSSSSVALPSQLSQQGLIKNVIAHCISGDGSGGGYLLLGDKLLPSAGLTWASFIGKPAMNSYALRIQNMFYGDVQVDMNSNVIRTAIFDSGTSYTYLVSSLYAAIVASIKERLISSSIELDTTDNTLPICWKSKTPIRSLQDVQHLFKPIVLEFKSGDGIFSKTSRMILHSDGYLIYNSLGNICLGLLDAKVMGKDATNIIGDISMQGNLIVYDNVNNRLGWMKRDCTRIVKGA